MIRRLAFVSCFVCSSCALLARAADDASPADTAQPKADSADGDSLPTKKLDKIVSDYADSGIDGVVDVMKDKNDEIKRVVIVGAARISTALGAADGLQTARNEARLRAVGKFRQFLKEKVSIVEKTKTERIIKLESKGEDDLTETGKKVSKNTEEYKTSSEGIVQGVQVLGYKTVKLNEKEKMYVMVLGWSKKGAAAARKLAGDLDREGKSSGKEAASQSADSIAERRKLADPSGTAKHVTDFFKDDDEDE